MGPRKKEYNRRRIKSFGGGMHRPQSPALDSPRNQPFVTPKNTNFPKYPFSKKKMMGPYVNSTKKLSAGEADLKQKHNLD